MHGSLEDLSLVSLPDISFPEETTIPIACWQEICLSKIWIPSHLLTNRRKPSNTCASQGIFRTLEKRGHAKQIESFSVYSDSDNESEADVFLGNSDDAYQLDSINSDKNKTKENSLGFWEKTEHFSKFQSCKEEKNAESNISLHEILNSTREVDINNFELKKINKYGDKQAETFKSNKKNKNDKKKNKVAKSVTLDQFLEDYTEENRQEDYANDYLRKLYMSQNTDSNIQLKNNSEFPDLTSKEIQFVHYQKPTSLEEKSEISLKTLAGILIQSDKTENDNIITSHVETVTPQPKIAARKILIENIPSEVCHTDIFTFLSGYGEIKDFSVEVDGDFLKAVAEIDCDIDWIIECLNGTEAFGASSKVLKCYKQ